MRQPALAAIPARPSRCPNATQETRRIEPATDHLADRRPNGGETDVHRSHCPTTHARQLRSPAVIVDVDCATRAAVDWLIACDVYVRTPPPAPDGAPVTGFLGLTAEWWTAAGTVATAVVATLGAGFAAWQVWEFRRTRDEEARPFVIVDIQPSPVDIRLMNLVVENVGRTVARNVRLSVESPLESSLPDLPPPSDSILLTEGIPMMPPGRRIEPLLDRRNERDSADLPQRYDVTVELDDARGRRQEPQKYVLDLTQLVGLRHVRLLGVHHVADALQTLANEYTRATDEQGRLKVWVRDEDRHNDDARVEHVLTGEWPSLGTVSPPDWVMAVGRNPFVRGLIEAVPPVQRWLRRRL